MSCREGCGHHLPNIKSNNVLIVPKENGLKPIRSRSFIRAHTKNWLFNLIHSDQANQILMQHITNIRYIIKAQALRLTNIITLKQLLEEIIIASLFNNSSLVPQISSISKPLTLFLLFLMMVWVSNYFCILIPILNLIFSRVWNHNISYWAITWLYWRWSSLSNFANSWS